jgi:hypothetical protein
MLAQRLNHLARHQAAGPGLWAAKLAADAALQDWVRKEQQLSADLVAELERQLTASKRGGTQEENVLTGGDELHEQEAVPPEQDQPRTRVLERELLHTPPPVAAAVLRLRRAELVAATAATLPAARRRGASMFGCCSSAPQRVDVALATAKTAVSAAAEMASASASAGETVPGAAEAAASLFGGGGAEGEPAPRQTDEALGTVEEEQRRLEAVIDELPGHELAMLRAHAAAPLAWLAHRARAELLRRHPQLTPMTEGSLKAAVKAFWEEDGRGVMADFRRSPQAEAKYGSVGLWDVSGVKSFSQVFQDCKNFNEDISAWDVGQANCLSFMFHNAKAFNQPLGAWDVRLAKDVNNMFAGASSFNQPLGAWMLAPGTRTEAMFYQTASFDRNVNAPILVQRPGDRPLDLEGELAIARARFTR